MNNAICGKICQAKTKKVSAKTKTETEAVKLLWDEIVSQEIVSRDLRS